MSDTATDQVVLTLEGDSLQADDIRTLRAMLADGTVSFDSFEWTF